MDVVVLDNGAYSVKMGFGGQEAPQKVVQNCAVRPRREKKFFVADQLDQIIDMSACFYRRPLDRGFVSQFDLEEQVWGRLFQSPKVDPKKHSLLLTEAPFTPTGCQNDMDEMVFETFGFASLYRTLASAMAHKAHVSTLAEGCPPCSVLVDVGYSFTSIVPMFEGVPINYAIKRLNVGGKLLTNYLTEITSYRAWNMMDETHLMNDIKEKLCYVSLDFLRDLRQTANPDNAIAREFVLPNGTTRFKGYVKDPDSMISNDDDQTLTMNNERISVPEVLFNPSNIGLQQAGLVDGIVQAIQSTVALLQGPMYKNVFLTGGSALFPGLLERVNAELRKEAPDEFAVDAVILEDPINAAWRGAAMLAASPEYPKMTVTKQEWEEYGAAICRSKFLTLPN